MTQTFNSAVHHARFKRALAKQAIILVGMVLLVVGFVSIVVVAYGDPAVFPQDQHYVILPILLFWLFLFRHTPAKLIALRRDGKQLTTATIEGLALLHNKPGFRIVLSPAQQLSVNGLSFDLNDFPQENCYVGRDVIVHYLPYSKLLLSVMPLQEVKGSDVLADGQQSTASKQSTANDLTELEVSIVQLMAEGDADKVIARKLNLEPATVRTYNTTLYRKLGVNTRKQAAEKAISLRIIDVN